jgi:hypothetical protein
MTDNDPYYGYGTGGAIYSSNSYMVVNSTTFDSNKAWVAGAIYLYQSAMQGKCNTFKANRATQYGEDYGNGGAIALDFSSFASEYSIWDSNIADNYGGVSFMSISEFAINKDTFLGNYAASVSFPLFLS